MLRKLCGYALIAGFATIAALSASEGAFAQASESDMRLSGAVRFAADLPSVEITAPSVDFTVVQAETPAASSPSEEPATSIAPEQTGTASAIAWYERFTVAPSESHVVWGVRQREFQLQGGNRWGVTLGYSESDRIPQDFSLDDFSAGAFYDFSDRFRFGGQLRFTSPEEEIFGEDTERKEPELRFESAFRF
jgi:hypothetical protein